MSKAPKKLALLVGGGPGINSVIGAATIRAIQDGVEVVGVHDGFKWIRRGDVDHVENLTIDEVSRIHFCGGSYIARSYMLRLSREDFDDPHELAEFAATANTSVDAFREGFAYLLDQDTLYRDGADAPKTMPADAVA